MERWLNRGLTGRLNRAHRADDRPGSLFATLQGIASLINGNIVRPELLDGLVESAAEQFLRGTRPLP